MTGSGWEAEAVESVAGHKGTGWAGGTTEGWGGRKEAGGWTKERGPMGPTLKRSPWGLMTMGSLLTGAITRGTVGSKQGFLGGTLVSWMTGGGGV